MESNGYSIHIPEGNEIEIGFVHFVQLENGSTYTFEVGNLHYTWCCLSLTVDGVHIGNYRIDQNTVSCIRQPAHTDKFTFQGKRSSKDQIVTAIFTPSLDEVEFAPDDSNSTKIQLTLQCAQPPPLPISSKQPPKPVSLENNIYEQSGKHEMPNSRPPIIEIIKCSLLGAILFVLVLLLAQSIKPINANIAQVGGRYLRPKEDIPVSVADTVDVDVNNPSLDVDVTNTSLDVNVQNDSLKIEAANSIPVKVTDFNSVEPVTVQVQR